MDVKRHRSKTINSPSGGGQRRGMGEGDDGDVGDDGDQRTEVVFNTVKATSRLRCYIGSSFQNQYIQTDETVFFEAEAPGGGNLSPLGGHPLLLLLRLHHRLPTYTSVAETAT